MSRLEFKGGYKRVQRRLRRAGIDAVRRLSRRGPGNQNQRARSTIRDFDNTLDLNHAKILFLRQNAIGDALISTPIFTALKAHYPNMVIDVLLNRRNAKIYDNETNVRRTYVIKLRPLDLIPNIRLIRRERYDAVVDLVHSPSSTSAMICLLSRAGVTIGGVREHPDRYTEEEESAYDIRVPRTPEGPNDRMLLRLAECLRAFDIDPNKEVLAPRYQCRDDSLDFADQLIGGLNTGDSATLIGVNISGAKAYKYWGRERFISLLNTLKPSFNNATFVLLYSHEYADEADAIHEATGVAKSGGTPTLDSFAALISRLDILITTDSSAVHFADSAGVPTVTLMIDPEGHDLWCPSRTPNRTLHAPDERLASIAVDDVAHAFRELYDEVTEANPVSGATH